MSLVLGLEHSCASPREGLSSTRLSLALASDFFCVLGLEPCVLDSTFEYEDLKINYEKLQKIIKKQAAAIEKLQTQSNNQEIREAKGEGKMDENEQYDRRQNLEIAGIPSKTGENTNKIVQEVAKLMNVNLTEDLISTSHRLPVSQRPNRDNTESKKRQDGYGAQHCLELPQYAPHLTGLRCL